MSTFKTTLSSLVSSITGIGITIKTKATVAYTATVKAVDEKIVTPLAPYINVDKFGPLFRMLGFAVAACLLILAAYYAVYGIKLFVVGLICMFTLHMLTAGVLFFNSIMAGFMAGFIAYIGVQVFTMLGEVRPSQWLNSSLAFAGYHFNRAVSAAQ